MLFSDTNVMIEVPQFVQKKNSFWGANLFHGFPEQQEKVHTQGSVTNLMALNLIWKHSK